MHRLRKSAHPCRQRLAQHQRRARRRTDQQFMHETQIAFPDDRDAVKNRDEQDALRQNARRQKIHDIGGRRWEWRECA